MMHDPKFSLLEDKPDNPNNRKLLSNNVYTLSKNEKSTKGNVFAKKEVKPTTSNEIRVRAKQRIGLRRLATGVMIFLITTSCSLIQGVAKEINAYLSSDTPIATETFLPQATEPVPQTIIETATWTLTPIPTETTTPTPTPTATELPVNVYSSFEGRENGEWILDISQIPEIPYAELTVGLLEQTELNLVAEGNPAGFNSAITPLDPSYLSFYVIPIDEYSTLLNIELGSDGTWNYLKEMNQSQLISLSLTDLKGTKLLILGVAYKGVDNQIRVLHYAFQNYQDPVVVDLIETLANGKSYCIPFVKIQKPYVENWGWYDYSLEPVMLDEYQENVEERVALFEEWQSTGKIPEELTKMFLLGFIRFFDPHYRQFQ